MGIKNAGFNADYISIGKVLKITKKSYYQKTLW